MGFVRLIHCLVHDETILGAFDTPPRVIKKALPDGRRIDEATVWDAVVNLSQERHAYRTVTDPSVYAVELGATDVSAPARKRGLSWTGSFTPIDV